jgi:ATP-dependent DNA helicase RecG
MAGKEERIEVLKLNQRQKKIMDQLRKMRRITTKEYVEISKPTRRTAIRDLKDMVNKKILRITGGKVGRERYYILM